MESLEDRRLFSTLTINTTADDTASDGQLSLREAIALIQNNGDENAALGRTLDVGEAAQVDTSTDPFGTNDTIVFDNSIAGGTITLASAITGSGAITIDGGASGMTLTAGSNTRAFYVGSTGNLTLNKLTITNFSDVGADGNASAGGDGKGGAIYVDHGTLTLTNSTLSNNAATGGRGDGAAGGMGLGGAIYIDQGFVTITGSTLDQNSAAGNQEMNYNGAGGAAMGGAIYNTGGTLTVTDSTLSNNSATGGQAYNLGNGGDADGGAAFVDQTGTVTVTDSTLSSNSATGGEGMGGANGGNAGGGALYVDQTGTLTVTGAITLLSNTATGGDGASQGGNAAGGAIANHWGAFTLAITGGTVEQNAAAGGYSGPSDGSGQGGAIYSANGTASLTFTNSTLSNNSATADANGIGEGGALFVDSNTLTVTNSTLAGNSAVGGSGGQGGAIYVNFGDTTISFSTLSANTAAGGGRGLYAWSGNTMEIDNSILGQSDGSVTDLDGGATNVSGSNNLIRNANFTVYGAGAIGIISNADPKLGPLQDNGGPTQTMRPATDSPAIDAADDTLGGAPSTDQRGLARPAGAYDIGAAEFTRLTLTVSSTADADTRDSDLSLREAIELANGTLTYADLTAGEQAWLSGPLGDAYAITFDPSVAGQTIYLGSQINVSRTMTIDGGASGMTLSGSNSRAFYVTSTGDLTLNHLVVTNFSNVGADGVFSPGGDGNGGAIFVDQGTLTITDCTLSNNSATGGAGSLGVGGNGRGGAIYVSHGTVTLSGSTLSNNSATGGYGTFANGGSAQGGALYVDQGTLTITDSTLSNNSAAGGASSDDDGGAAQGGAVYSGSSTLTITNSTLAYNSAAGGTGSFGTGSAQGGAAYVADGNSTLSFSTVSSNTAAGGGRGLYVASSGAAVVEIDNSILGQSDNSISDVVFSGTVTASGSNNLIRNATIPGVTSLSSADPKLGLLQDNGGPTQTMRPAADSPAIDAAGASGGTVTADQRGIARPAGAFDIGAAEFTHITLTVSTTAYNDTRDTDLTLREAVDFATGVKSYASLTPDEQAWASGPLGDVYTIVFDSSIAGGTIALGSQQLVIAGTVTIDGGTSGMTLAGGSGERAFWVSSIGDLTLNKLTLDNFGFVGALGNFTPGGDALGGAIYVDHGALTITNSTLSNNHVQGGYGLSAVGGKAKGGAIYADYGSVTITGSTLSGNIATGGYGDVDMSNGLGFGGAVYADHGALTITDSTLSTNTATGTGGPGNAADGRGGAVYGYSATLAVTGATTLQNNTASGNSANGGAISSTLGTFTLNITGGAVSQNTAAGATASGGAIYTLLGNVSLAFANSTLSYNSAAGNGSGGFAYLSAGAALSLTDCTVDHNTADGYGGAILLSDSSLSVTGGTATYNSATGTSTREGTGGFLYNINGTVTLTNATVSNNSVTSGTGSGNVRGGAIYTQGGSASVTIAGGVLDHNSAVAGGGLDAGTASGGAVCVNTGSLTITGAVLSDNTAVGSDSSTGNAKAANGGAIGGFSGIITITDSTLNGNAATGGTSTFADASGGDALGGAIYNDSGSVAVTNTTLANNSAVGGTGDTAGAGSNGSGRGGAIYVNDSDTTIDFSTLSANTAAQGGRGLYFLSPSGLNLTIDNSILGQADDSVTDLEVSGSGYTTSGSNNLIRNTAETGIGILSSADPKLGPLQDNGGPTPTMHPAADSPAVDAADDSGAPPTDQRGLARPSGAYDVGALELSTATLTVSDTADVDSRDSDLTLREAFHLIDGTLVYGDLTPDEQAQVSGSLGDVYFIEFDASLAGATFYVDTDDSNPLAAPPNFTPPVIGPTAFAVTKSVTITGPDGGDISLVNGASDLRLFYVAGTGDLTLQNLSIEGFAARGNDDGIVGEDAKGGAIYVKQGTLTLVDCELTGNSAVGGAGGTYGGNAYGGAIYNNAGTLSLTNTTFNDNAATAGEGTGDIGGAASGGALYTDGGTLSFEYVTFEQNQANGGAGHNSGGEASGGALFGAGATITGQLIAMFDNRAVSGDGNDGEAGAAAGGAIYIKDGSFTADSVSLAMNTARAGGSLFDGASAYGGAIYVEQATLTLSTFLMLGNQARGGDSTVGDGGGATGGAIVNYLGTVTLTAGTFSNNAAIANDSYADDGGGAFGGGLYAFGGSTSLTNVTMTLNSVSGGHSGVGDGSGEGGAVYVVGGDLSINFSTLTGNDADTVRGVKFIESGGTHQVAITNSILGEADDTLVDLAVVGSPTLSGSHNLIRNTAVAGVGNVSSDDPRLAPVADYGHMIPTVAILPDSPALDAAGAAGGVTTDGRGAGRGYHGASDIGAFESQGYTLTVDPSSTPQSAVAGNLFGNLLAVTLTENGFDMPISGATILFAANPSGSASATFLPTATTDGNGQARVYATANGHAGSYTVTASLGGPQDETADFALANTATTLSFTSATEMTFTAGTAGAFTITTTGTPAPTLTPSGTLPAGLTFTDNGDGTATLSGVLTGQAGGTYTLIVTAQNGGPDVTVQIFTLTVNQAPSVTSAGEVALTAGQAGALTVTTAGFPVAQLSVTGTLPAGVTFVDNGDGTGTFSGTPTAVGTFAVTVVAGNGVGQAATQDVTITVAGGRPIIVASGYAGGAIQVNNPDGTNRFTIGNPFKKNVGARLASADLNGDGVDDVIAAAGPGGQPQVVAYDGVTGEKIAGLTAFAKSFTGGMFVTAADVDGDGTPDIVVSQGLGGASRVRVFSGKDQSLLANFKPLAGKAVVGARIASADLDGDGYAEIITGQGSGNGKGMVKVFDGLALTKHKAKKVATLSKAQLGFAGGVFVATGDVNGDGTADVIVSQSEGNQPYVAAFDGKKLSGKKAKDALISKFSTASDNGARIASYDVNADGFDDIVTGLTVGDASVVKIFSGADGSVLDTIANDTPGGVFVA